MRKSTKTNDGITAIYVRRSVSDKKTVVAILTNPEIKEAKTIQMIKATPHDPRLTPLHIICLPAFRHITQILLDLRQQACVEFRQSDENLDGASDAQGSCGVALIIMLKE